MAKTDKEDAGKDWRSLPRKGRTKRSKALGIRVTPDLYSALQAAAERDRRTLADYCCIALANAVGFRL